MENTITFEAVLGKLEEGIGVNPLLGEALTVAKERHGNELVEGMQFPIELEPTMAAIAASWVVAVARKITTASAEMRADASRRLSEFARLEGFPSTLVLI